VRAGDVDYDATGHGYAAVRRADPRVAAYVHAALGDAPSVVNVGAGAGSYEPAGRLVVAVEPSDAMRAQRPPGAAPVVAAVAERLPFADGAFGAAMAMSTVHQWPDLARGLAELRRVSRGPVVVLTFDAGRTPGFWLSEYLPDLPRVDAARMPPVPALAAGLGGEVTVTTVPVPADCADGFVEAFYGRPEAFLDPAVRAGQSLWGFVDPGAADRALGMLAADLASGAWDARYGHLREQPSYDGSLVLVTAR
jgi:SAM-dependent methyltransferase